MDYASIVLMIIGIMLILVMTLHVAMTVMPKSIYEKFYKNPVSASYSNKEVIMLTYDPQKISPLSRFDIIYFINLDHRTDRLKQMTEEFQKVNVNPEKVKRIPGVVTKQGNGEIGCYMAHINVLKDFISHPEFKTCVIFEDDFQFTVTVEALDKQLQAFFDDRHDDWDVLMLSSQIHKHDKTKISDVWTRVLHAWTLSGYAVNRRMAATLLQNYEEGLAKKSTVDNYWRRLQPKYEWYALQPLVGTQRTSHSDIRQKQQTVKSKAPKTMKKKKPKDVVSE